MQFPLSPTHSKGGFREPIRAWGLQLGPHCGGCCTHPCTQSTSSYLFASDDSLVVCHGIKSDSSSRETISGRKGPGKIEEAGRWSPILVLRLVPGLGTMHVDKSARDSLACDLMEPIRYQIDAYLLDWITRQPLRREWFCEQRDGNCRRAGSFGVRLSETAPIWRRAVAPIAEWVARAFWSTIRKPDAPLPTRLTQNNKREAKGLRFNHQLREFLLKRTFVSDAGSLFATVQCTVQIAPSTTPLPH